MSELKPLIPTKNGRRSRSSSKKSGVSALSVAIILVALAVVIAAVVVIVVVNNPAEVREVIKCDPQARHDQGPLWEPGGIVQFGTPVVSNKWLHLQHQSITATSVTLSVRNITNDAYTSVMHMAELTCSGVFKKFKDVFAIPINTTTSYYVLDVTGLKPNTVYSYYFREPFFPGSRSKIAQFRTLNASTFWDPSTEESYVAAPLSDNWIGLQAGDMTPNGFTISVGNHELAYADIMFEWARKDARTGLFYKQPPVQVSAIDGTTPYYRVQVTGLQSSTEYFYYAREIGHQSRSLVGRVKTLPAPYSAPKKFKFGSTSCMGFRDRFGETLSYTNTGSVALMSAQDVDLILNLGDHTYNDFSLGLVNGGVGPGAGRVSPFPGRPNFRYQYQRNLEPGQYSVFNNPYLPRPPITHDEFLEAWSLMSFKSPNIRDSMRSAGMWSVNDDHEVFNDYGKKKSLIPAVTQKALEMALLDAYVPITIYNEFGAQTVVPTGKYVDLGGGTCNTGEACRLDYVIDNAYTPAPPNYTQADIFYYWSAADIPTGMIETGLDVFDKVMISTKQPNGARYYTKSYGNTADFIFLDCNNDRGDGSKYISDAQMAFVKNALKTSTKPFKFLVSSRSFVAQYNSPRTHYDGNAEYIQNTFTALNYTNTADIESLLALWSAAAKSDFWQYYAKEFTVPGLPTIQPTRQELLQFVIDEKINGFFILAGDAHDAGVRHVGDVDADPDGRQWNATTPLGLLWEIAVGGGGSTPNTFGLQQLDNPNQNLWQSDVGANAFSVIEPDPENHVLTINYVRADNEVMRSSRFLLDDKYNVKSFSP